MQPKIIEPTVQETVRFGRRSFVRKVALATGGAAFCLPNLIINPVYAGTALIVDSSGDKRIALTNAAIARAFDIGTWSTLRLGMRLMVTGSATLASELTPTWVFGLQSGESSLVLDTSVTNFIGIRSNMTGQYWAYTAGTPAYFSTNNTGYTTAKKVGSTWTNGSYLDGSGYIRYMTTGYSATKQRMLMLQIMKGSPKWSFKLLYTSGTADVDISRSDFLDQMTIYTPSLTNHTWVAGSASNDVTFDESAGTIDHVAVGWDRPEFAFQISDIAVSKIAV